MASRRTRREDDLASEQTTEALSPTGRPVRRTISLVLVLCGLSVAGVVFLRGGGDVPLSENARADLVVVEKARRQLHLYDGPELLKTYRVALGPHPAGHKEQEGDGRTPEGRYVLDYRNAESSYHLSLHGSYPNTADRARAAEQGVSPGGDIMIHGLPPGATMTFHPYRDWTLGCIAVTSEQIEEIWRAVPNGTPIEIRP